MSRDPIGLLDTSALVAIDGLDPGDLPAEPVICAITHAGLSVGNSSTPGGSTVR
ncbi:MAG: hypothetical protein S0880_35740 [Actinomycetota bacterium]|nr:hypothetical protein [Actinomycetota bacterium]